jgi:hypothetical protein
MIKDKNTTNRLINLQINQPNNRNSMLVYGEV